MNLLNQKNSNKAILALLNNCSVRSGNQMVIFSAVGRYGAVAVICDFVFNTVELEYSAFKDGETLAKFAKTVPAGTKTHRRFMRVAKSRYTEWK